MIKTYANHTPTPETIDVIREMRESFSAIHVMVEKCCPNTRERSVALTHLETAAMWAVKALAVNDPNAKIDMGG